MVNLLEKAGAFMSDPQSDIPPMPIEIMLMPILTGLLIGFAGIIVIELGGNAWGIVLICFGAAITLYGYMCRRNDWRRSPEHRSNMLRHLRW